MVDQRQFTYILAKIRYRISLSLSEILPSNMWLQYLGNCYKEQILGTREVSSNPRRTPENRYGHPLLTLPPDCVSNLMVSGSGLGIPSNAALLGLPFLRTTFAVFRIDADYGPQVGLAHKPIDSSYASFSVGANGQGNVPINDDCI